MPINYHRKLKGKISICSKDHLDTQEKLASAYTPGVAEACKEIVKDYENVYELTNKWNNVAIISDGTRVLGLGNIGPYAAIPVMEGKAMLFKEFANIDAFPICLNEKDKDKIIDTVKAIEPVFGGINLEDIENPKCFFIEKELINSLNIPVFHDDQHGTAIVVLAGLINAIHVLEMDKSIKIVVNGVGAAGNAITNILLNYGFKNIICLDSKGILNLGRKDLNEFKLELAKKTNKENLEGNLETAAKNADVIISTAGPNTINEKHVKSMNDKKIIFAISNPIPDIDPKLAEKLGVNIIATGRSDFRNQVNNLLAFPGVFRGALDSTAKKITDEMKIAAAEAIANYLEEPTENNLMPSALDKRLHKQVAISVGIKALDNGITRKKMTKSQLIDIINTNLVKN
ncbi:MAG: NADP-dependent malic enzyme [Candidatus Anstonellales archaeon]